MGRGFDSQTTVFELIPDHRADLAFLLRYCRSYIATYIAVLICLLFANLGNLAFPYLLGRLIDRSAHMALSITALLVSGDRFDLSSKYLRRTSYRVHGDRVPHMPTISQMPR